MPYTHFRYIAYELPTATHLASGGVVSGFPPGTNCPAVAKIPVPAGLSADVEARLLRFAAVVKRAWDRVQALGADNANTLKIFMAPEFYFRPPTATGANYDSDTYPTAIAAEVISAFDTMFQHNDFDNWLIIPGTVLWNGPAPDAVNKLFYNTALHVRGGAVNQPTRIIEKKIASGIDGVPSAYTPGGYADLVPFYQRWAVRKSRSFSSGGINFGLDICLDHLAAVRLKVCKQVLHDWPVQEGNVQDAQIHLLTAGGMTINDTSVAATVNGYILRNDGYANAPRSQQKKINKYTNGAEDSTPSNMNSKALMAIDAVADASIVLVGDECVPNKDGGVFIFPQRIVVYPITGPI